MSITSLIRKARKIKDLANPTGSTRGIDYYTFEFDERIDVAIATEDGKTKLKGCTCLFHSTADPRCMALCSYYLAVLLRMADNIK